MRPFVLVRGGGDLASGVVLRLQRIGIPVLVTELPQPLVVRRAVSFAQAVFDGECQVEEVHARLVSTGSEIETTWDDDIIPVMVSHHTDLISGHSPLVLIDARMTKQPPGTALDAAPLVIGLGPGFTAGADCHAVIETQRGHRLGRVIWEGAAAADTGVPETVAGMAAERVLRASAAGVFETVVDIGALLVKGDLIARVGELSILAPFDGLLRGLLHPTLEVTAGQKVGDLDPRGAAVDWRLVSDKALSIAGGVMEALLSRPDIRRTLWERS